MLYVYEYVVSNGSDLMLVVGCQCSSSVSSIRCARHPGEYDKWSYGVFVWWLVGQSVATVKTGLTPSQTSVRLYMQAQKIYLFARCLYNVAQKWTSLHIFHCFQKTVENNVLLLLLDWTDLGEP